MKTETYDYQLLYETEPTHFWFWAKNRVIGTLVKQYLPHPHQTRFLEIGCGTGFVLGYLEKLGFDITGVDLNSQGLKYARRRVHTAQLICTDVTKNKTLKNYDAVGLFDVLEHIEDEITFLRAGSRCLKNAGLLFITVPADILLWSIIDKLSGHKRRYSLNSLRTTVQKSGYQIEDIRYFSFFLYLAQLWLRKSLSKRCTSTSSRSLIYRKSLTISLLMNFLFKLISYLELKLFSLIRFPFGASLIAVARKRT
ncbi:MAG: Methyltransferase type 11 [Candidatus Gottesmanbacteria bacterium GW2011_GWB1_43_11]|uniref:Methyltransferase type 11 n=1 Tax=Candidatus Gottesmanbacteria bacterium GW2011_GWB1_43_11 TaxID=1618446 RepID=A0A0G1CHU3_9BACT|nr:MAG: Methyltransferase type 11 [Candidatus Gottesmanbacteria bacterium GW2011_GWA2_42_16]KKS54320.1 MAG: Methyltransferase type 11 [Candidatus Gottesmanbacteria bacterium GW2011_GWA1_42_26]KKS80951.1 MAG: Methyltransferase type 11 [Candidatus Gottesmanbacteria bacterium GW2011_GWC1_43_10]KKS85375.1 MAG: Methyltransferase type 11 [Candidatus Gottesmanbacteria bacterium GW2011_GWB1_43_11]OGG09149.1 MAG: hypothetical protein A2699_04240 [Candidatus Gottesmanbacteria bacterium RIFCSPHIGHO2_01_FU